MVSVIVRNVSFWLALCLSTVALADADGQISAHSAWVRATPPGAPNTAAYLVLRNAGQRERVLVAVSSEVSPRIELHNVIEHDGLMKMRQVAEVAVPGAGEVQLAPGGLHVMIMGLGRSLQVGESIALQLRFADGESLELEVPVRRAAAMAQGVDHSQMDHGAAGGE